MAGKRDMRMQLVEKVLDEISSLLKEHIPILQKFSLDVIETVFIPKTILRQLSLLFALEVGMVTLNQVTFLVRSLLSNFSTRARLIQQLLKEQQHATTQDDWMDLAEKIDRIQGHDVWRSDDSSNLYERDRISARIDEYVHLMRRQDIFELMFVLRGSIGRNKFGLLNEGLFNKALAGSKILVETYHNIVCSALNFVCDANVLPNEDPIPTDARLAFFNETRHSYGRTALLLSGGAALGFYHVGVVRALMQNQLMPRVIGGASAGSLVCAMIGTRTDAECENDLFQVRGTDSPGHSGRLCLEFFRPARHRQYAQESSPRRPRRTNSFWDVYHNTAGAFHDAKLTIQGFVPIPLRHFSSLVYNLVTGNRRPQDLFKKDTDYFRECVRSNVGNFTFQEAFDRTGRILNIVVTPQNRSDPPRLLNYLTAPHVLVWSAAVASSSLPGVFEANRLVVKEADGWERYESGGDQAFADGSMEQDLPMQQLSEMFNVNHFIVAQANPHAVLFGSYGQKSTVWTTPFAAFVKSIMTFLKDQLRDWTTNIALCLGIRSLIPYFAGQRGLSTQFLTQEYEGRPSDISFNPWGGHRSIISAFLHMIYNPSETEFQEWAEAAQRETWRHIPTIKSHIAEEITLDRCVQRLRKRLVAESWEKHARLSTSTGDKISERVPSFFASPSLTNLGGLGVTDQPNIEGLRDTVKRVRSTGKATPNNLPLDVTVNPGWSGLGLKGNRSSGNLVRSTSDASGLFIEEEDVPKRQEPGESPETELMKDRVKSETKAFGDNQGYVKTTSMANFYYRKTTGHGSTGDLNSSHKSNSNPAFVDSNDQIAGQNETERTFVRRKSKSFTDFSPSKLGLAGRVVFETVRE